MGDLGSIPALGRSPEKGRATHSTILARRIPRTEEPGGLQSKALPRVSHFQTQMSNTESPVFLPKSTLPRAFFILANGNHSFDYLSHKPWSHTRQNHASSVFKIHSQSNNHFSPPPPLCSYQRRLLLDCFNNLQNGLPPKFYFSS